MSSLNNTTIPTFEPWFIAVNISMIISLGLAILLAIIYLIIVLFNKSCRTIPMMLSSNSCIAEIVYGSNMIAIAFFTFENDRKQRIFQDALCTFRDYFGYVGTALLLYSFVIQAIYRYMIAVYPMHMSWQSARVQIKLICFSWIFSITSLLPSLLTGAASYNVDNQVCVLPFRLSAPIAYNVSLVYIAPISLIILIYFKLVRYVHEINDRTASSTLLLSHNRRALIMVQRIVTIVSILVILGLPYTICMFMSFITKLPKYHFRISVIFIDLAQTLIMIALFKYSQSVMDVLWKLKCTLSNASHLIAT